MLLMRFVLPSRALESRRFFPGFRVSVPWRERTSKEKGEIDKGKFQGFLKPRATLTREYLHGPTILKKSHSPSTPFPRG